MQNKLIQENKKLHKCYSVFEQINFIKLKIRELYNLTAYAKLPKINTYIMQFAEY